MTALTLCDHVGSLVRVAAACWAAWLARRAGVTNASAWSWSALGALLLELRVRVVARRARPPGRTVALSRGHCHFVEHPAAQHTGAMHAPVVLLHGFAGSHLYFRYLAGALAAGGRRVICMDNYGRGFSSAGAGTMGTKLFAEQLRELLDVLRLAEVDLVGYSMGGGIALEFAARYPDRIHNLCLLAPAGMPSMSPIIPRAARLAAKVPGVDLLLGLAILRRWRLQADYTREWDLSAPGARARAEELHGLELTRLPVEGFRLAHALGRSIAWFPWDGLSEAAAAAGRARPGGSPLRVLAVWGALDRTVPVEGLDELRRCVPQLASHVLPRAGHAFPLQSAEETAGILEAFLRSGKSKSI